METDSKRFKNLKEISLLFLKLGVFSFGGPAVYISLMYTETVRRRRWIDEQHFLDLVGATNLIPGPNATEMAIHLGLIRGGLPGLISAGALFILPGMLATLIIACAYVRYGSLPEVGWILYGIKPVVIGVVVGTIWSLGKKTFKNWTITIEGVTVALLYLLGLNEIALLFGGAIVFFIIHERRRLFKFKNRLLSIIPILMISPISIASGAFTVSFSPAVLFFSFLKIGSVLYGSGYILLAFLRSEFVLKLGWLTNQQILDAIVAGQITPGPVSSSATFIGYLLGGWSSAIIATFGIFLPSFLFVGLLSRVLPFVRKSFWAGLFLDGVNASSLGLMAAATVELSKSALIDIFTVLFSIFTVFIIFRYKINFIWLILGGGLIGIIVKLAYL